MLKTEIPLMHPVHHNYNTLRKETIGFIPGLSYRNILSSQKLKTKFNEII